MSHYEKMLGLVSDYAAAAACGWVVSTGREVSREEAVVTMCDFVAEINRIHTALDAAEALADAVANCDDNVMDKLDAFRAACPEEK